LINIANKRMADLAEIYEDDPLFNKKVESFDFYQKQASQIEKDQILEEVEHLKDHPLKLANKMLQIGEKYYNENYKELDEAGGLKELISFKNSEIERMQRKLDKLERKLSQYNDYDSPTNKIDELGDTENVVEQKPESGLDEAFGERDRKKR
jgi:vacuolar-type H+-ATPase subunit I/STV1